MGTGIYGNMQRSAFHITLLYGMAKWVAHAILLYALYLCTICVRHAVEKRQFGMKACRECQCDVDGVGRIVISLASLMLYFVREQEHGLSSSNEW